jgi:glutamyl-tRNA synthetase
MNTLKTRIAPTPSGFLHIGNAYSFLLTWLIARGRQGTVHLRIDDIDSDRVRPEYMQDIFDSLQWLGIDWDTEARSQMGKEEIYKKYLTTNPNLSFQAEHLMPSPFYICYCSRKTIQQNANNGLYGQTCLPTHFSEGVALGKGAIRLHIPASAEVILQDTLKGTCVLKPAELAGDLVVWRKNDEPAYQLASLVDDVESNIDFIVRGEDLWNSTVFQLHLAEVLGLPAFSKTIFLHHPLVLDDAGQKLSKSEGAPSLHAMRKQGILPAQIYKQLAVFWGVEVSALPTLQELLESFKEKIEILSRIVFV